MHGLIYSHLYFCSGFLTEISKYQIDRLQRVKKRAARIVIDVPHSQPCNEILRPLLWLTINARVMFNVLVLMFRTKCETASTYIRELFTTGERRYRSSDKKDFDIPRTLTKMTDRSIAVIGPKWSK